VAEMRSRFPIGSTLATFPSARTASHALRGQQVQPHQSGPEPSFSAPHDNYHSTLHFMYLFFLGIA
jgi:hypothetical protein